MKYKNENWLYQKYHIEDKHQSEIADSAGVSIATISYWMDKCGIETKPYERARKEPKSIDKIIQEYKNGSTLAEIATGLSVSHPTVARWLKEAGVTIRDQYPTGEDNVFWDGGYKPDKEIQRFYSSRAWKNKRNEILKRDGYKCTQCGDDDNLEVHHLMPIKSGGSKLKDENLMTVCKRCHNYIHNEVYFG